MSGTVLIRPSHLLTDAMAPLRSGWSVLVARDRIAAVGPDPGHRPDGVEVLDLAGCLLMPGLINAHQHGRGISQLLLGYADDRLEPWIAQRRARGAPDAGALTRVAALEMLGNGVTCAVHANYSYGSGNYEAEVRAALEAYIDVGLRVTFCIGAMDRGELLYPGYDEGAFIAALLPPARDALSRPASCAYAGDAAATVALMRRLQIDYGSHPLITLAYGPAGPQWASDDLLRALARDAADYGLGLHLHALESPTQAAVTRKLYPEGALRGLARLGVLGARTTLAHCVHLEPDDVTVAAASGASVVHNPGSNLRLSNGIAPVAALLAAGVPVALGTDNCALSDDEDLLAELHLADLLARLPTAHSCNLAPGQLLGMVTTAGARAAFVDDRCGRVAPGLQADLVALRLERVEAPYRDPDTPLIAAVAARARGEDVALTMVAGKVRYRDGCWPGVDGEAARSAAAATAAAHRQAPGTGAADLSRALREGLRALYGLP